MTTALHQPAEAPTPTLCPTHAQVLADLRAARLLISPVETWCRRAPARDNGGGETSPESRAAVQWCAIGAICVATTQTEYRMELATAALNDVVCLLYPRRITSIPRINDRFGHAAILAVFDHAIGALAAGCAHDI